MLTPEELRTLETPCHAWVEDWHVTPCVLDSVDEDGCWDDVGGLLGWEDYNVSGGYRYWLRKPTDEERAATPWAQIDA